MSYRRNPTFKPTRQIGVGDIRLGARERHYLDQVIASNRLSYGPMSQRFEREFAELHDCRYASFGNSGTAALHIALAALKERHGWQDGDEVIIPAVTFVATANVVLHNGLHPVFVDVDAATYNLDPALMEQKITSRTRGIIPVHLMGLPCEMDPIMDIAGRHGLRVIEDSCEAMFATYKGRKVGSFGDLGCFSTYVAHFIVTGVGGFTTTNDGELAVMVKSLMNHGRDAIYLAITDDQNVSPGKLFEIAARRFSFVHLGHSSRCTELEAAIGLAQLEQRDEIIRARRDNARYFTEQLSSVEDRIQLPAQPPDREHGFMLFPIALRHEAKQPLINFLEERLIETRDLMPLVNQPIYRRLFGEIEDRYPVAKWLNGSAFYIGCHQYLTGDEREYVVDTILEFLRR